jgi:two-component system, chemotaxis family, CheB/CheR fusion protein
VSPPRRNAATDSGDSESFRSLLEYLKASRGFDFSGYKRSSLERRIQKRMQAIEIDDYERYQDHLQVDSEEFTELFNTILINVTGFFRDRPAWDYVTSEVVPALLDAVPDPDPIRVWSAACASGEEAYTAAIVLAEALGEDEFRRRVKIYATDVDEAALQRARMAAYSREALKGVPDDLAEKYFHRSPLGYAFQADLRRSVIFGRNDLVQDAPISKVDLLISRNALMYFTPETQARILGHFNFALKDTGYLFLGKSEMLITHADLFTPHNLKWRVFRRVPRRGLRHRLAFVGDGFAAVADADDEAAQVRASALDVSPIPQLVVDGGGYVVAVNQLARRTFGLGAADLGRPLQDLELSYRPTDLRSALGLASEEGRPVAIGRVDWTTPAGEAMKLNVTVTPITSRDGSMRGASFTFEDVTGATLLDEEFARSKRQLETAYEELQSTVEELETTNEELHSTNEELETTNEELQSSNEELETMNEELQSTNDELETMNDEQALRAGELDQVNLLLEGILGSLGVSVVVLDTELRVQVWNANSTELWGLLADEVEGERLLELDLGLPVRELREPLQAVLSGEAESRKLTVEAVTRRGRHVECEVATAPLRDGGGTIAGAIMLTELARPDHA